MNHISAQDAETMKFHLHDTLGKENLAQLFTHDNIMALTVGCIVSFVVALLAIRFFIGYLQKHGFQLFGYYRIILGITVLALIYTGVIHA